MKMLEQPYDTIRSNKQKQQSSIKGNRFCNRTKQKQNSKMLNWLRSTIWAIKFCVKPFCYTLTVK